MKRDKILSMNNKQLFVALLVYKIVIEIIYLSVISPLYSYYGMITDINVTSFILSLLYIVFFNILIPENKNRASTTIYVLIGVFMFVPTISYYWMSSQSHVYTFLFVLCFTIVSLILRIKRIYIKDKSKIAKFTLLGVFILYVISSLISIYLQGGLDVRALNFDTIYSLREDINLPIAFEYLLNWSVKAFTPLFFAYFLYKKKYISMVIVLLIQLSLYLSFGFKAYLFSIGLLIICLVIYKFNKFEVHFTYFYTFLIIFATLSFLLFNIDTLLDSISFRMVFVPAQAQFQYYDFFSVNPKVYFAEGLIGTLFSIESPYSMPMFNVISNVFYGRTFGQNTAIFADAYGNAGVIGMICMAILLGVVLYTIDSVTDNIPKIITVSAFSYLIFVLNDNSLLTALLTGGIGVLIILFYLFNTEIEYKKNKLS